MMSRVFPFRLSRDRICIFYLGGGKEEEKGEEEEEEKGEEKEVEEEAAWRRWETD